MSQGLLNASEAHLPDAFVQMMDEFEKKRAGGVPNNLAAVEREMSAFVSKNSTPLYVIYYHQKAKTRIRAWAKVALNHGFKSDASEAALATIDLATNFTQALIAYQAALHCVRSEQEKLLSNLVEKPFVETMSPENEDIFVSVGYSSFFNECMRVSDGRFAEKAIAEIRTQWTPDDVIKNANLLEWLEMYGVPARHEYVEAFCDKALTPEEVLEQKDVIDRLCEACESDIVKLCADKGKPWFERRVQDNTRARIFNREIGSLGDILRALEVDPDCSWLRSHGVKTISDDFALEVGRWLREKSEDIVAELVHEKDALERVREVDIVGVCARGDGAFVQRLRAEVSAFSPRRFLEDCDTLEWLSDHGIKDTSKGFASALLERFKRWTIDDVLEFIPFADKLEEKGVDVVSMMGAPEIEAAHQKFKKEVRSLTREVYQSRAKAVVFLRAKKLL